MVRQESAKLSFPGSNPGVTSRRIPEAAAVSGILCVLRTKFSLIEFLCKLLHLLNFPNKRFHPGGAFLFHSGRYMSVNIQSESRCGVSKIALNRLDVIAGANGSNCAAVPQIVKAGIRAAKSVLMVLASLPFFCIQMT